MALRDAQETERSSEQALEMCLNIQQSLLNVAEGAMYPTASLLLDLVQQSGEQPKKHGMRSGKTHWNMNLTHKTIFAINRLAYFGRLFSFRKQIKNV